MSVERVLLVTKTSTQNQGNQALSIAWLTLLGELFPDASVGALERMPAFLKRFRVAALTESTDPVTTFEGWAAEVAAMAVSDPDGDTVRTRILHRPEVKQAMRFLALRRALAIRSRLANLGVGKGDYRSRLGAMREASLVVVNPAGEFQADATDTALAYLLDLRVAQLLGARTAMVNLSFEIEDATLRTVAAHVMDLADLVEFRDVPSADAYATAGGQSEALVLPDAALLTELGDPAPGNRSPGTVGLAINGLQARAAGLDSQWSGFIETMRKHGSEPVLVSNEWSTDEVFWRQLRTNVEIESMGRDCDYREYGRLLGGFEVVVSSRLHTCVLALCAGTAVVPVETGTFKLSGFFEQIGLPNTPVNLLEPGWQEKVLARVAAGRSDPTVLTEQLRARDEGRARLRAALGPRLAELA